MKPVPYYFFRLGVQGSHVPRFVRRLFAKTYCHRMYVFGRFYGLGFYKTDQGS
jgi:hypothetical protein